MIRIGIIGPSEIALRRFLPALKKLPDFQYMGVAIANTSEWFGDNENNTTDAEQVLNVEKDKAAHFVESYGGKIFEGYSKMIKSEDIDAIYLPLPPGLHFKWAQLALKSGKHVFIEKPATTCLSDTANLILLAKQNKLAIHENYMFIFHEQLKSINNIIESGEIGDVRLYKISFGFPRRSANDFRYNKKLGGGALLDCGGYTIKYASILLGKHAKMVCAQSNYIDGFEVDIFGSATLVNDKGVAAQVAFGMDNSYKCDLEVWGSLGNFSTGRVLTAPDGYTPEAIIKTEDGFNKRKLPADDAFMKSILRFKQCIEDDTVRESNFEEIRQQSKLIDNFKEKSNFVNR